MIYKSLMDGHEIVVGEDDTNVVMNPMQCHYTIVGQQMWKKSFTT